MIIVRVSLYTCSTKKKLRANWLSAFRFSSINKFSLSSSWRGEVELPKPPSLSYASLFFTTNSVEFKFYGPPSFKLCPSIHPLTCSPFTIFSKDKNFPREESSEKHPTLTTRIAILSPLFTRTSLSRFPQIGRLRLKECLWTFLESREIESLIHLRESWHSLARWICTSFVIISEAGALCRLIAGASCPKIRGYHSPL